jgi:hypothetical protein
MLTPALATVATWLTDNAVMLIGVAVVVVGLFVVGRTDVPRFSGKRVWAISGVCFAESVRRRVLWIIPLAILGLVAVVQLQQPTDEQDAIRQTTKFCLYASGLVVVLSTLILACTNLPREIENRVIFTVVTKPTTRLEIVLGKVVGFARVSFVILLTMGLFTWGYLHLRARLLTRDLEYRLAHGDVEPISVPTSRHYVEAGLLNAKTLADPVRVDFYGRPPVPGSRRRYLNNEGSLLAPFVLPPNLIAYADPAGKQYKGPGLRVLVRVGFDPVPPPAAGAPPAPAKPAVPPMLSLQVFDSNAQSTVSGQGVYPPPVPLVDPTGKRAVAFDLSSGTVAQLMRVRAIYIVLTAAGNPAQPLWVEDDPTDPANRAVQVLAPVLDAPAALTLTPVQFDDPSRAAPLTFAGRDGTYGEQVKGDPAGASQTCVFQFRDLHMDVPAGTDTVPLEMRVGIEKNGDTTSADIPTDVRLTVTALTDPSGKGGEARSSTMPLVHPENNRTLYAAIPTDAVRSGNFDVGVQCLSPDQWVGLKPTSVSVVQADSSFGWNLTKSLGVLWMLAVLVTAISVFCSTFLTWPTAVVLTIVLLLGRWGLDELGDAAAAGLGRSFVTDFGVRDPAAGEALAGSVDLLNRMFKNVASVFPDITSFAATDDIDRGVSIPLRTLFDAGLTLFGFGVPLTVAAYVIFKNKEVAP